MASEEIRRYSSLVTSTAQQRPLDAVDWEHWRPTDQATLLFVIDEERILLIRKKRGLGAGKINGPGGRLEPGESAHDCALRELQEELRIRAWSADWRGNHRFQFIDGYRLDVDVFVTDGFDGEPTETDEAIPLWFPVSEIPYDEMWADDRHWFPHLLDGSHFYGRWLFDGDRLIDGHVVPWDPSKDAAPSRNEL